MATGKTAQNKKVQPKPKCPRCGEPKQAVRYACMNRRFYSDDVKSGMWWVCTKACGYEERTT